MYGLLLIVEAVRQLRGECRDRQVQNANIDLVPGNGGVLSSQVTAVLTEDQTGDVCCSAPQEPGAGVVESRHD